MARSKWKRGRTAPTLCADVRRFSQLNNTDKVFGTHTGRRRVHVRPPPPIGCSCYFCPGSLVHCHQCPLWVISRHTYSRRTITSVCLPHSSHSKVRSSAFSSE